MARGGERPAERLMSSRRVGSVQRPPVTMTARIEEDAHALIDAALAHGAT